MVRCMYGFSHRASLICRVQAGFAVVSPALMPLQKSQGNLSQRLNRFWPPASACQLDHSAAFPGTSRTPAQVRDAHCDKCRLQQSCRKHSIPQRQLCTTFAQIRLLCATDCSVVLHGLCSLQHNAGPRCAALLPVLLLKLTLT